MSDEPELLTPPWYWKLAYRLLFRRLPEEYGPWIAADLTRRGWPIRVTLTKYLNTLIVVAFAIVVWHGSQGKWPTLLLWFGGFLLALLPFEFVRSVRRPVSSRKEILDHQGIDKLGLPLVRATGPFDRLRTRWLPRPDLEAVGYLVLIVLVLNGTAAVGFSKRNDTTSVVGVKLNCKSVPDAMRAAVAATLTPGTTIKKVKGAKPKPKFKAGFALAAELATTDAKKTTIPYGVWMVESEGKGYRVSAVSNFGNLPTTARQVTLDPRDQYSGYLTAFEAYRCVLPPFKPH